MHLLTSLDDDELELDEGLRDRPLVCHWSTSNRELVETLGIPFRNEAQFMACNSILTEAVLARLEGRRVSYSRRPEFYSEKQRYHGTAFSYRTIPPMVDLLAQRGLVEKWTSSNCHRGTQSQFWATDKLLELWAGAPIVYGQLDPILRKDKNKNLVSYTDTAFTIQRRKAVQEQNEALTSYSLELACEGVTSTERYFVIDGHYYRRDQPGMRSIFIRDSWRKGGRNYHWVQNIPRPYRPQMTLNGEPVAQPDFSRMHAGMLYDEIGKPLSRGDDAYDIPGFDRSDVKLAFNVLINARNRRSAYHALMDMDPEDWDLSGYETNRLFDAIELRHPAIARYLHSDCGVGLQFEDSEIMMGILNSCRKAGIAAFPIHDAVLCTRRDQDRVIEFMEASYASRFPGLNSCKITPS